MTAGFVAIEIVEAADADGNLRLVPDVEDLDDLKAMANRNGTHWDLTKGIHHVTFRRLGRFAGMLAFEVSTTTTAAWNALTTRLGARTFTYVDAASRPAAQRAWLEAEGFRVYRSHAEGDAPAPLTDPVEAVAPQHTIAGQNPRSVAIPEPVEGRVYYPSTWSGL